MGTALNTNSSILSLKGSDDEVGNYTCHWNSSLGQARFKQFTVTYVNKTEPEKIVDTSIAIGVSVPLSILLLISIIVVVTFYFLKVS